MVEEHAFGHKDLHLFWYRDGIRRLFVAPGRPNLHGLQKPMPKMHRA